MLISKVLICTVLCASLMFLSLKESNAQDLNEALKLIQSERYEDADAVLKKLIESNTTVGDACFYYGECLLRSYVGDPYSNSLTDVAKEASDYFKMGLQKDSTNMLNNIGLGAVILLQKNDTSAADVFFSKAEITIPKKAKKFTAKDYTLLIKLGLAQLYAQKPRYNKAVMYLERAKNANVEVSKDPKKENPDIYVALGDIYVDKNDASEAVKNYNKAVWIDPSSYEPLVKIGRLYMRSRNLQEARNYFDRAKEIDSTYAPLYRAYGEMFAMGGVASHSKTNFKKFLELSGSNIPAKVQYVNSLFRARDYKECIINIEAIFAVDKSRNYLNRIAAYSCYEMRPPDYAKAKAYIEEFFKNATPEKIITRDYAYYGRILLKMKDTALIDKGIEQLITAYKLDTTDFDLISDIASNAYYSKRFNVAVEMLNKKIAAGTAKTADYMTLGKTYYQIAQSETDTANQVVQYKNAEVAFMQVSNLDPQNLESYVWIANTYASMDPDSKLGLAKPKYELVLEKALSDTLKNAKEIFNSYSYLSSFYFQAKDYNNAITYAQKIVNMDAKNISWQTKGISLLAGIYHIKKDYPKALFYYKKVLALDPNNEAIKKTITQLQKTIDAKQDQQ
jgi:tetratricopeptide (TPR) repeat protein